MTEKKKKERYVHSKTQATSLTSPLPSIHPVLDPLIVSLADPGAPASGRTGQSQCEVQIEVEDVLNSDAWRLIGEILNPLVCLVFMNLP